MNDQTFPPSHHEDVATGKAAQMQPGDLESLLRSLPREQASLGFEERVLRRVREQPRPPMTMARGLRLAAPLVVAAALGFVFGPSLLERGGSEGTELAASAGVSENTPLMSSEPRSITDGAYTSRVDMPTVPRGSAPARGLSPGNLEQVRAEAARVRQKLEELRQAHSAAGATVTLMLDDGVEVQVDLRELLAALQAQAAEQGLDDQAPDEARSTDRAGEAPVEPPLY